MATPSSARLRRPGFRPPAAIPSPDLGVLGSAVARTRAIRILLAALLIASFVAAFLVSRGLRANESGFLPGGRSAVIVLDMSASVGDTANRRIAAVLQNAVSADQPTGLVIFSDTAYELVSPRTPGEALRPMIRFFEPRRISAAERRRIIARQGLPPEADFIKNPWQDDFRGGTRISAGLRLAREMLRRDHVHGSVLLVSDLAYAAADESDLTRELFEFKRTRTPLRIVPLFPTRDDRALFAGIVGSKAFVSWKVLPHGRRAAGPKVHEQGAFPLGFIALGIIGILLLTVNELRCARLSVPRSSRR